MRMRFTVVSYALGLMMHVCAIAGITIVPPCENDFKEKDFPFVGQLININNGVSGSAVAIGNGKFIITSKHCVTHDGKTYGMLLDGSNFVYIQNDQYVMLNKIWSNEGCDMAIGLLTTPVRQSVKLANYKIKSKQDFYGVGYGMGCSKINSNKLEFDLPYGTKRVYKNTIQGCFENEQLHVFKKIETEAIFYFILREKGSRHGEPILGEGMPGPGDSGGGLFVYNNGEFELFAIVHAIKTESPMYAYATDCFAQKTWIQTIVLDAFSCEKQSINDFHL